MAYEEILTKTTGVSTDSAQNLTDEQKAQARENIGAQGKAPSLIPVVDVYSEDGVTYTGTLDGLTSYDGALIMFRPNMSATSALFKVNINGLGDVAVIKSVYNINGITDGKRYDSDNFKANTLTCCLYKGDFFYSIDRSPEFDDDNEPTENSNNFISSGRIKSYVDTVANAKQDKLVGTSGQIVCFNANGNAVARNMPTASEVGALSDTTTIPTKTSDLENDSNFFPVSSRPSSSQKAVLAYRTDSIDVSSSGPYWASVDDTSYTETLVDGVITSDMSIDANNKISGKILTSRSLRLYLKDMKVPRIDSNGVLVDKPDVTQNDVIISEATDYTTNRVRGITLYQDNPPSSLPNGCLCGVYTIE